MTELSHGYSSFLLIHLNNSVSKKCQLKISDKMPFITEGKTTGKCVWFVLRDLATQKRLSRERFCPFCSNWSLAGQAWAQLPLTNSSIKSHITVGIYRRFMKWKAESKIDNLFNPLCLTMWVCLFTIKILLIMCWDICGILTFWDFINMIIVQ